MDAQEGQKEAAPSAESQGTTPPSEPSNGASTKSRTSAAADESDPENQLPSDSKNQLPVDETPPLRAGTKRNRAAALLASDQSNPEESSRKSFIKAVKSRKSPRPESFVEAVEDSRKAPQEISQSL